MSKMSIIIYLFMYLLSIWYVADIGVGIRERNSQDQGSLCVPV